MDVSDSKAGRFPLSLDLPELSTDDQTDKVSLDSTYDSKIMPVGPHINLRGARLVQQPLFDNEKQLVRPWEAPSVFRKGTLVAVEAKLGVYHFMGENRPTHVRASNITPLCTNSRFG